MRAGVHLSVMAIETRNLRLRVTWREEPDLGKLIEWVLVGAEHRRDPAQGLAQRRAGPVRASTT